MNSGNFFVTFCYRNDFMRIHKTSIAALNYPDYIRLLIDKKSRLFAIQPCDIRERDKIRVPKWTDIDSSSVEFHGKAFLESVTKLMGWSKDLTYRISGSLEDDAGKPYLLFRLSDAEEVKSGVTEGNDLHRYVLFGKGGSLEKNPGIVFDSSKLAIGINGPALTPLDRPTHIQLLLNVDTAQMLIRGVNLTEKDAHRIPSEVYERSAVYGITGDPLVTMIYDFMEWDSTKAYSVKGAETPDGVLFSLKGAGVIDGWERRIISEEFGLHE